MGKLRPENMDHIRLCLLKDLPEFSLQPAVINFRCIQIFMKAIALCSIDRKTGKQFLLFGSKLSYWKADRNLYFSFFLRDPVKNTGEPPLPVAVGKGKLSCDSRKHNIANP